MRRPLTEFYADGLNNYPQIVYTFADRINDNQVAELSNEIQKNGIDAFSINNNELKISVLTFLSDEQTQNLSEDEQYAEKYRDFESKADAAATSVGDVLGRNENASLEIRIKKSHYAGAKNEGTQEQTREYDRSDIFKPFLKVTSKAQLTEEEVPGYDRMMGEVEGIRQLFV